MEPVILFDLANSGLSIAHVVLAYGILYLVYYLIIRWLTNIF